VGDTVGDPFKDTSSVAMNPIIKFATLFGLLAVELAITMVDKHGTPDVKTDDTVLPIRYILAAAFFVVAIFFVYRSFYGMRIVEGTRTTTDELGAVPATAAK
jgi:K(+)-stimulated pyrophosphate-energized sodium pump